MMRRDAVLAVFVMVALTPSMAHAYIDPGFGALVWQAAFAAIAGALFFFRSTIAATGRWMKKKMGGAQPAAAPAVTEKSESR